MRRHEIGDAERARIGPPPTRGPAGEKRRFVNAALHVARTGVPRRDLPGRFGSRNSARRRFARRASGGEPWKSRGTEARDPDARLDGGPAAPGRGEKKPDGTGGQAGARPVPGRVRDEGPRLLQRRRAVAPKPTATRAPDILRAEGLPAGRPARVVVDDEGDDGGRLVAAIRAAGAEPAIPPMRRRRSPRGYDRAKYRLRDVAERLRGRVEQFRRVAARDEKTAARFPAFVRLAAVMVATRPHDTVHTT